jgi:hypothetical protein
MTNETFEAVELGQAEVLIEVGGFDDDEEMREKYVSATAPYVEFE